jgi:hypothetical protein
MKENVPLTFVKQRAFGHGDSKYTPSRKTSNSKLMQVISRINVPIYAL